MVNSRAVRIRIIEGPYCSSYGSKRDSDPLGGFGPFVLGVSARKLSAHLRIKPLPESGEIAGDLHRPAVRRKQMHYNRSRSNARSFAHSEKILQPRFDPWRLTGLVVDPDFPPAGKLYSFGRKLIETGRTQLGENIRNFGEARPIAAQRSQRRDNIDLDFGKGGTREQLIERLAIDEASYVDIERLHRQQLRRFFRRGGRGARLLDHELIINQCGNLLDSLSGAIPFQRGA